MRQNAGDTPGRIMAFTARFGTCATFIGRLLISHFLDGVLTTNSNTNPNTKPISNPN